MHRQQTRARALRGRGTGSAQTGGFTPSSAGDVTQDEFPTGEASDEGPDPYGGTISFSNGTK